LSADNIDREMNTLFYSRLKTGEQAQLAISSKLAAILAELPHVRAAVKWASTVRPPARRGLIVSSQNTTLTLR